VTFATSKHALIEGLRRAGDEPQLTQALAGVFRADSGVASQFARLLVGPGLGDHVPDSLVCAAEEVVANGRLDLRLTSHEWDLIVELKIHAGYGRDWLARYLAVRNPVEYAYVVAVTRSVPLGEAPADPDNGWLGAVRWRALLPDMRRFTFRDPQLGEQWLLFLDVLEEEGSMGFTRADPALFTIWAQQRVARKHVEDLLRMLQPPLLVALQDRLGGGADAADSYRSRNGRPVVSWAAWGKADLPFLVPKGGPARVRAGLMGWSPPVSFFVEPHGGGSWIRGARGKGPGVQRAVHGLLDLGYHPKHFRAYLELPEDLLTSATLEETIVAWASERFGEIVGSGLFDVAAADVPHEPDESGDGEPPG